MTIHLYPKGAQEYLVPNTINLVKNPSFETDLAGWVTVAGAQLRINSYGTTMWAGLGGRSGSWMVQATSDGTNAYLTTQQASGQGFDVNPGEWVGVSALVASDIPAPGRVRVDVQCDGTATTYHAEPVNSPSGFYAGRRALFAFQVPATATSARIRIQGFSGSAALLTATNRIWADNVIAVVRSSEEQALAGVTPYFDGSTTGAVWPAAYGWAGTAHASASYSGSLVRMFEQRPLLMTEYSGATTTRHTTLDVIARSTPIVVLGPGGMRDGRMEFLCRDHGQARQVQELYQTGIVVLVDTEYSAPMALGMHHVATSVEVLPSREVSAGVRRWVARVDYLEVPA